MEQLHQSKYFLVSYHQENQLFYYVFNETTESMSAEEYIDELKVFIELVRTHKPTRVLGHMVDFKFAITPDIQEWVNNNLFSVYQEIGFKKIAILLSKEFIAALSIEQTMEEDSTQAFQTSFFDEEAAAMQWLLEE